MGRLTQASLANSGGRTLRSTPKRSTKRHPFAEDSSIQNFSEADRTAWVSEQKPLVRFYPHPSWLNGFLQLYQLRVNLLKQLVELQHEIRAIIGVQFLGAFGPLGPANVPESTLQKFHEALIDVLRRRYRDHWFPEKPFKGSGFRCIQINGKMDPVIGQAGDSCGLSSAFLHSTFPSELTMWIDPLEVSYRIGENGSICVLYEFSEGVTEPWQPASLRNSKNSSSSASTKQQSPDTINKPEAPSSTKPSCKDSLRMDYLLDPKKSVSIEQLAVLVSS